jgi:hypothetical protein
MLYLIHRDDPHVMVTNACALRRRAVMAAWAAAQQIVLCLPCNLGSGSGGRRDAMIDVLNAFYYRFCCCKN